MADGSATGGPTTDAGDDRRPATEYGFLDRAIAEHGAAGFVHVADCFDPTMRYLTRFAGPDRPYAFVYAADSPAGGSDAGTAALCAPALFVEQAREEFPGDRVYAPDDLDGATPGERAAEGLADLRGGGDGARGEDSAGPVLAPAHLPHDAALRLESAGFELASTTAVADARAVKTDAEVDRIRAVQAAAQEGIARIETILSRASIDGDQLRWAGEALTTDRLRREANATMAHEGVEPAGNSVVAAGPACADLHFGGDVPVRPGETVLADLSPRGPHGYHGDITRTFVVAGEGGWERRAHVAAERALDAGLATVAAGVPARDVHTEVAAEIGAYGFRSGYDVDVGFYHGAGHGVGLALHEAPSLTGSAELEAGHVVTVEPGVYDPEQGGVRVEDLVVVTDDGYETLTDYPRSLVPEDRGVE